MANSIPIQRRELFSQCGTYPIMGLRHCLSHFAEFGADTLEKLKAQCDSGEITPGEIFRIRGNGNARQPGILPRYLFGLPSYAEKQRERITLDMGAGI